MIKTNLIVARAQNSVIGKDGTIPWNIQPDLQMFFRKTKGHAVVMGRKTYESVPTLKNRLNIVVSKTLHPSEARPGVQVVTTLTEARLLAKGLGYSELWVIGGERLYEEALPLVDEMHITEVDIVIPYTLTDNVARFKGDLDRSRWVQTGDDYFIEEGDTPAYSFTVWKRRSKPALYENDMLLYEHVGSNRKELTNEFVH